MLDGVSWRVGDGSYISVLDKWMGMDRLRKPELREGCTDERIMVSNLIGESNSHWITERVKDMFNQEDAHEVLNMSLNPKKPNDNRVWSYSKSGKFTVKSAYYLAIKKFSSCGYHLPSSSYPVVGWERLWQIRVPQKISHFLWGTCSVSLPNLLRRGLSCDPTCPLCGA